MLGLSPTVYGVTKTCQEKKKEGLNLAHKPGDLGAFARSSSIPFYYSVSTNSDSWQSLRDIEDLELHRKTKHFPSSLPSREKKSAWDECHWFFSSLSLSQASFRSRRASLFAIISSLRCCLLTKHSSCRFNLSSYLSFLAFSLSLAWSDNGALLLDIGFYITQFFVY